VFAGGTLGGVGSHLFWKEARHAWRSGERFPFTGPGGGFSPGVARVSAAPARGGGSSAVRGVVIFSSTHFNSTQGKYFDITSSPDLNPTAAITIEAWAAAAAAPSSPTWLG
jgi:hypothetical protein